MQALKCGPGSYQSRTPTSRLQLQWYWILSEISTPTTHVFTFSSKSKNTYNFFSKQVLLQKFSAFVVTMLGLWFREQTYPPKNCWSWWASDLVLTSVGPAQSSCSSIYCLSSNYGKNLCGSLSSMTLASYTLDDWLFYQSRCRRASKLL